MMKRTPGLIVMVLGILVLHRLAAVPVQPTRSASIQAAHGILLPADESGDDDGDDDGDSGDSE
jgi:hypothetical protein